MSYIRVVAVLVAVAPTAAALAQSSSKDAIERGAAAVRGQAAMNPAVWSAPTYDHLWKQWGLPERPANFTDAVRERYGLHAAPYPNDGLPMGLHYAKGLLGKGIVNDCLLCHAGTVAGQTIIGVGNASLDLQGLFDDLTTLERLPIHFPFRFSYVRGTVDVVNPVVFLMEMRDADLKLQKRIKLDYSENVASDPPAWWLLKHKRTRNWTGGVRTPSLRVDMVNLLSPFNSPAHIKKHAQTFADIHAFVMSVEAPKYPFPIDAKRAAVGRGLFNEHCARCHGTYGPGGKYPSKIVPLETIGTDRTLATAVTRKNLDKLNRSWFGQESARRHTVSPRGDGRLSSAAARRCLGNGSVLPQRLRADLAARAQLQGPAAHLHTQLPHRQGRLRHRARRLEDHGPRRGAREALGVRAPQDL